MSSFVDMSLEDIIQKKKNKTNNVFKHNNNFKKPNNKITISDARNKIISKKRIQITDAREKLAELARHKDARMKLDQLRQKKIGLVKGIGRTFGSHKTLDIRQRTRNTYNKEMVFHDITRQVRSQPRHTNLRAKLQNNRKHFMEGRSFGTRDTDTMTRIKPIIRTVENDVIVMDDDEDDPMGEYNRPTPRISALNRNGNLNLKIIAHNNDVRVKQSNTRRIPAEKERSPQRLPSILKKRPMASLRTEKKPKVEEAPEYRIIVSNLRSSVTAGDIQELFGDVGGMVESRLVRPGTAEVIYKTQEDAQRAVDLYHNRQLDRQPMNCLLVIPRSNVATRGNGTSKPSLPPNSSCNVEPDISTIHKVLFSNF